MNFKYNDKIKKTQVFCEKKDLCLNCDLIDICPLIAAIENHIVYTAKAEFNLVECAIYEPIDDMEFHQEDE